MATKIAVFAYFLGEDHNNDQELQSTLTVARLHGNQRDIATIQTLLGQNAGWQSNYVEAEARLQESLDLYKKLGDQNSRASVLHGLAELYIHTGYFQKGVHYAQACLNIGLQLGREDLIGNGYTTLGAASFFLGQYKVSLEQKRQGQTCFEKTEDRLGYALSIGGVGRALWPIDKKNWSQAVDLLFQSLTICREIGHRLHVATRLFMLGQVHMEAGRHEEAEEFANECIQIATESDYPLFVIIGLWVWGESACMNNNFSASRIHLKRGIESALAINSYHLQHVMICYARLLEREAAHLDPTKAIPNRINAVTLATSALRHPAWRAYHLKAEQLLARQKEHLPPVVYSSVQSSVTSQTVEEIAARSVGLRTEAVQ